MTPNYVTNELLRLYIEALQRTFRHGEIIYENSCGKLAGVIGTPMLFGSFDEYRSTRNGLPPAALSGQDSRRVADAGMVDWDKTRVCPDCILQALSAGRTESEGSGQPEDDASGHRRQCRAASSRRYDPCRPLPSRPTEPPRPSAGIAGIPNGAVVCRRHPSARKR